MGNTKSLARIVKEHTIMHMAYYMMDRFTDEQLEAYLNEMTSKLQNHHDNSRNPISHNAQEAVNAGQ